MATFIGACGSCCDPLIVPDGASINITGCDSCFKYETSYSVCQTSDGVTFVNLSGGSLNLNVSGIVDDDVSFNGVVYEDGEYCFFRDDCTWGSTPCTYVNGAHSFSYKSTLNDGSSLLIQGIDNGFGGSISCTINFS